MTHQIDYFYHLHHRRLRTIFRMDTIARHEDQLAQALARRHEAVQLSPVFMKHERRTP